MGVTRKCIDKGHNFSSKTNVLHFVNTENRQLFQRRRVHKKKHKRERQILNFDKRTARVTSSLPISRRIEHSPRLLVPLPSCGRPSLCISIIHTYINSAVSMYWHTLAAMNDRLLNQLCKLEMSPYTPHPRSPSP